MPFSALLSDSVSTEAGISVALKLVVMVMSSIHAVPSPAFARICSRSVAVLLWVLWVKVYCCQSLAVPKPVR